MSPAFRHALAVLGRNQAHAAMGESEASFVSFGSEAILNVIHCGIRHHQWPPDFQQLRRLDHLHVTPEMPRVVAQIAEPAPARSGFQLQRHKRAIHHLCFGAQFVEHRCERDFDRRGDFDLLLDLDGFDTLLEVLRRGFGPPANMN